MEFFHLDRNRQEKLLLLTFIIIVLQVQEQGWHSRLLRGPEFDSQISHPCFDFFPFRVDK